MDLPRIAGHPGGDIVELLLKGVKDLKPLARDLGVYPTTLRDWREQYLREQGPPQGTPQGLSPAELSAELRRVRKENETLKRQRDILKKALGILSEQPPESMP